MNKQLSPRFLVNGYPYIMVGLVVLEVALMTFWRRELGLFGGPVVLIILAFLISFYPIWKNHFHRDHGFTGNVLSEKNKRWIVWGIFVVGIATLIPLYHHILQTYPIDIDKSDIIPTIKVCVRRFLNGEPVYAEITEFPYPHFPNYFPFKWLPFIIPEIMGMDYRWLPLAMVATGLGFYHHNLICARIPTWMLGLLSVAPWLILLYYHLHMPWNIAYTVELLDLGYYLIMTYFLIREKVIISAISLTMALLSRVSFAFWLPAFLLGMWAKENKSYAVKLGLMVFAGVILLFVLPFVAPDRHVLAKGEDAYFRAARASWSMSEADRESGKKVPHVMRDETGFASWVYILSEKEPEEKIRLIQKIHLGFSLSAALLTGLGWLLIRWKIPAKYYFLFSLKLYLGLFYAWIQVPFFYLFITPLFLSLFLLQEMNMDRWNAAADGGSPLQQ
ncbi:MAG: hypothetical protein SF052_02940 [Bacteroidia bacterium]|nr:hypothetical protein [Bacteroidia bacterium]